MVRPKKHLGQHFLTDPGIARRIVEAIDPAATNLLEIGPGKGILTKIILENAPANFHVVEIDTEAADYLQQEFIQLEGRIIRGDFLRTDLDGIFPAGFSVIGNFPYNISSQILFRVLELRNRVPEVVGMFQKEVAERVAAPPGSKTYGILSVLVQAWYDIEYLFTVKEGAFFPPPRVRSAVIRLRRNNTDELPCDEKVFVRLVKAAFNQRRKTLRNALKGFTFDEAVPHEVLRERAEQLSIDDFISLARNVRA